MAKLAPPEIYLDYQASTPLSAEALEAMLPFMVEQYANPHATEHAAGWRAAQAVERAEHRILSLLGAEGRIIFTSGATEANNLALWGAVSRGAPGRDRIVVSAIEHPSVLETAIRMSEKGLTRLSILPVTSTGVVLPETLENALGSDVLLVSIISVSNEVGIIQDVPTLSGLARAAGALFHTDVVQAPCGTDIDRWGDDVDLMTLSAHKVYGPKGIGCLYVAPGVVERLEAQIVGGGQQFGMRSGTLPVALCVGFAEALAWTSGAAGQVERTRVRELRDRFLKLLLTVDEHLILNGPHLMARHAGNLNVRFSNVDARDLILVSQPSLSFSSGSACASGAVEPSPVLLAMGLSKDEARRSCRFSVGRMTTFEDLSSAIRILQEGIGRLSAHT